MSGLEMFEKSSKKTAGPNDVILPVQEDHPLPFIPSKFQAIWASRSAGLSVKAKIMNFCAEGPLTQSKMENFIKFLAICLNKHLQSILIIE